MNSQAICILLCIALHSLIDHAEAGNLDTLKGCVTPETRDELQTAITTMEAQVPASITRELSLCKGTNIKFEEGDDNVNINVNGPEVLFKCEYDDECTIDGGNKGRHAKNSREFYGSGGFLYVSFFSKTGSALTVQGIKFINFGSTQTGGVVAVYGSSHFSLKFQKCKFYKNYSRFAGGVLFMELRGDSNPEVTIKDCNFNDNEADTYGGAIGIRTEKAMLSMVVKGTHFYNNYARESGGGISLGGSTRNFRKKILIQDCHFKKNKAGQYGGGVFLNRCDIIKFETLTFKENTADYGEAYSIFESSLYQEKVDTNDDSVYYVCYEIKDEFKVIHF